MTVDHQQAPRQLMTTNITHRPYAPATTAVAPLRYG